MNELVRSSVDQRVVSIPARQGETLATLITIDETFSLREYWRVLDRHKGLIIGLFCGIMLAVIVVLLCITPMYHATCQLLIDQPSAEFLDIKQLAEQEEIGTHDFYSTQYEIMKSRSIASEVIRELDLEASPLLNGSYEGRVWRLCLLVLRQIQELLPLGSHELASSRSSSQSPQTGSRRDISDVSQLEVEAYLKLLTVTPVGDTRLVTIGFEAPDPQLAAKIVNAHVHVYMRKGLELRAQADADSQFFFEKKLVELKDKIEKSEAALNSYRHDRGIIGSAISGGGDEGVAQPNDHNTSEVQRLDDLTKALTGAEVERIALEAQVQLLGNENFEKHPAIVNNVAIQNLKAELINLEGEYASLSQQFTSDWPALAQLGAKVQAVRRLLQTETGNIASSVKGSYQAALRRETDLQTEVNTEKGRIMGLSDASVQDAVLVRDVQTNRDLYKGVLERMKEMGIAAETPLSNISVVDLAEPPLHASRPQKRLILSVTALLALFGSLGLAFLREHLDDTIKTAEEVERHLHLPNLGMIPEFSSPSGAGRVVGTYLAKLNNQAALFSANDEADLANLELVASPFSAASEAYRVIRTGLLLCRAEEAPKVVLITSSITGEGKTVTTVNLAASFAQMGAQVLLVDADLRRPDCHRVLAAENGIGLSDFLAGHIDMDRIILSTEIPGLFFLPAGSAPLNPSELLSSSKTRTAFEQLRATYDYVFLDSTPIVPVTDSVILSNMADGVILLIGPATSIHLIVNACSQLKSARARILGVIRNRVDPASHELYKSAEVIK